MKYRILPRNLTEAIAFLLVAFMLAGCASTKREEEEMFSALDDAQKRMEKIETEEQDFDIPEVSGKEEKKRKKRVNKDADGVPILVTVIPSITFYGRGSKIELEEMFLTNFAIFADLNASSGYAATLSDKSSKAEFSITLPVGRYECLLAEKASDAAHATVRVSIGDDSYDTYPSDPPLGVWELTTRMPIYFDVTEEKPYLISISSDVAGMSLDYIQFVKME